MNTNLQGPPAPWGPDKTAYIVLCYTILYYVVLNRLILYPILYDYV